MRLTRLNLQRHDVDNELKGELEKQRRDEQRDRGHLEHTRCISVAKVEDVTVRLHDQVREPRDDDSGKLVIPVYIVERSRISSAGLGIGH